MKTVGDAWMSFSDKSPARHELRNLYFQPRPCSQCKLWRVACAHRAGDPNGRPILRSRNPREDWRRVSRSVLKPQEHFSGVKLCRFIVPSLSAREQRCQKSDRALGPLHTDAGIYASLPHANRRAHHISQAARGLLDDQRGAAVRPVEAALSQEFPMTLAMLLLLAANADLSSAALSPPTRNEASKRRRLARGFVGRSGKTPRSLRLDPTKRRSARHRSASRTCRRSLRRYGDMFSPWA